MSAERPGRASGSRAAEQEAANLGASAAGDANRPGTATDEAESRVQQAVDAANEVAEKTGGMGEPGPRMNRRSPFYIGLAGAAGVAVTYGLVELLIRSRSILIIIGLGLFIAVGLDPVVGWLTRRGVPRWAAVLIVLLGLVGVIGIFLATAIPPLTAQTTALAKQVPTYIHQLQDHNSELGRLNVKYHIQQRVTSLLTSKGSSLIGGVVGAGELVLTTASSILAVIVLTIYFLAGLPSIKLFAYRMVPHSRRPRVILITDQIMVKVGGYVLDAGDHKHGGNCSALVRQRLRWAAGTKRSPGRQPTGKTTLDRGRSPLWSRMATRSSSPSVSPGAIARPAPRSP